MRSIEPAPPLVRTGIGTFLEIPENLIVVSSIRSMRASQPPRRPGNLLLRHGLALPCLGVGQRITQLASSVRVFAAISATSNRRLANLSRAGGQPQIGGDIPASGVGAGVGVVEKTGAEPCGASGRAIAGPALARLLVYIVEHDLGLGRSLTEIAEDTRG
jgi:hypothetical protein